MSNVQWRHTFILFAIWTIAIVIIQPFFELPVNDDWSYIQNVQSLYQGIFELSFWPSPTTIAQTGVGYLYSLLVGFSIVKLRVLTMILGFVSVLISYLILEKIN